MRHLALLLLVPCGISVAFSQAPARARRPPVPPACTAITAEMLGGPVILPAGCYTVNQFLSVHGALTLKAGVSVVFGGGSGLSIDSNGSLEAVGTAEKPIVFRGKDNAAGFWAGITIASRSSHNHFSYVTVEGAGVKGTDNAALVLAPGSQLALNHSTVRESLGNGIFVMDDAAFTGFEANHFANTDVPLRIKATDIAMMDAGTSFAENKNNVVLVPFGEGKVNEAALWKKLAVPYRFEASVNIEAKVTIEAGTQLQFRENLPLNVDSNGSLTAIGTSSEPIVFTGTDETKGYWSGVFFESASSSNILRHVIVRYSGSKGGAVGGCVGITHQASASIQNSDIASCPIGIYVASEGRLNADAATSNRFVDVDRNIVVDR